MCAIQKSRRQSAQVLTQQLANIASPMSISVERLFPSPSLAQSSFARARVEPPNPTVCLSKLSQTQHVRLISETEPPPLRIAPCPRPRVRREHTGRSAPP